MRMRDPMVMNIAQRPAPSSHPETLGPVPSQDYHLICHQVDCSHFVSGLLAAATIIQFCDILSGRNLAKHRQYEFVKQEQGGNSS